MKTIFLHYYIVFKSMPLTNHFLYVLFLHFFSAWVLFLLYCTLFVQSVALPHTFNVFHFNTIFDDRFVTFHAYPYIWLNLKSLHIIYSDLGFFKYFCVVPHIPLITWFIVNPPLSLFFFERKGSNGGEQRATYGFLHTFLMSHSYYLPNFPLPSLFIYISI